MFKIPVLLLTFKRPLETKKVLNQILSIKPKTLYIFQDGKKNNFSKDEIDLYNKTTELIKDYQKLRCIKYFKFKKNIGQRFLAKKVLNVVFKNENEIIFLEDDTYPEKSFFRFCSTMLKKYKNNEKVYHISGCNLHHGTKNKKINDKSFIFSKYPQFWGWATWKKKWNKLYEAEISDWEDNKKEFLELFDKNNDERRFFNFYVENNSKTKHIGWDIPWIYKLILNKKLTVISAINLIKNIGFKSDPSGKGAQKFRNLRSSNIKFPLKIEQTHKANSFYDNYLYKSFYHRKNFLNRVFFKILKIIKK
ncbi:hypothetical protein IDG86_05070 [Pelagibacterales bacterium SAG-MED13]|nr:hypothetical protein [Pelagibacterales bacterium SAG-MED13]|tara:strand:- start:58 stop:975 length:918 start_codon:yes stop_codon:yes gene_type:complete